MTTRNPGERDFEREPLRGGCQCGAIRFRISAPLTMPHVCHCRMCQKASGSAFLALGEVGLENFAWTRGEPSWFRSSEAVERGFCAACGTSLHFRYVGSARIDVSLASRQHPDHD
ncbi:GFA family protein [Sediminimonas qiaohouensis]|uniref:GFA family protein n=1 Tax=Sediminimonas qiaohouensis TaxID=552061 RepID=UPI0009FCC253|nr:GFA family protein [Sediminimonas qiaohouensis]